MYHMAREKSMIYQQLWISNKITIDFLEQSFPMFSIGPARHHTAPGSAIRWRQRCMGTEAGTILYPP